MIEHDKNQNLFIYESLHMKSIRKNITLNGITVCSFWSCKFLVLAVEVEPKESKCDCDEEKKSPVVGVGGYGNCMNHGHLVNL